MKDVNLIKKTFELLAGSDSPDIVISNKNGKKIIDTKLGWIELKFEFDTEGVLESYTIPNPSDKIILRK